MPGPSSSTLLLRDVQPPDLPLFFEHQRDPDATQLAGFPARDWDAFIAHWNRILANPAIMKQTVLAEGQVAGNIVAFDQGGRRQVGYWLGKSFWGRGLATGALRLFLNQVPERPVYAYIATMNHPSRRVLEKCGFLLEQEDGEEVLFKLPASGPPATDFPPPPLSGRIL